jgi:O-antigen/teichoic acid export membrane protein
VALGLALAQIAGYAQTVVAARALGAADFGAFAALLGLLLIGSVIGAGFQAAGARRIVAASDLAPAGARHLMRSVALAALVVGAIALALTPLVTPLLDVPTWAAMPLVALTMVPVTLTGGQYGIAQGRERLYALGAVYAIAGIGKGVGGLTGALLTGTLTGALIGLCLGAWVAIAVGALIIRPLIGAGGATLGPGLRAEALHAAHALAALYVLTNIDVILARALLPAVDSGGYAVGAIVAKIAFWLPQFIIVATFPRLSDERRGRALPVAVAATATVGAVVTAVVAVLPATVVRVVGGPTYAFMSDTVWLFALAGSTFALGQTLVFARIAMADRRTVVAVWASAAVVLIGSLVGPRTTTGVVLSAVAGGITLCALGVVLHLTTRRRAATDRG